MVPTFRSHRTCLLFLPQFTCCTPPVHAFFCLHIHHCWFYHHYCLWTFLPFFCSPARFLYAFYLPATYTEGHCTTASVSYYYGFLPCGYLRLILPMARLPGLRHAAFLLVLTTACRQNLHHHRTFTVRLPPPPTVLTLFYAPRTPACAPSDWHATHTPPVTTWCSTTYLRYAHQRPHTFTFLRLPLLPATLGRAPFNYTYCACTLLPLPCAFLLPLRFLPFCAFPTADRIQPGFIPTAGHLVFLSRTATVLPTRISLHHRFGPHKFAGHVCGSATHRTTCTCYLPFSFCTHYTLGLRGGLSGLVSLRLQWFWFCLLFTAYTAYTCCLFVLRLAAARTATVLPPALTFATRAVRLVSACAQYSAPYAGSVRLQLLWFTASCRLPAGLRTAFTHWFLRSARRLLRLMLLPLPRGLFLPAHTANATPTGTAAFGLFDYALQTTNFRHDWFCLPPAISYARSHGFTHPHFRLCTAFSVFCSFLFLRFFCVLYFGLVRSRFLWFCTTATYPVLHTPAFTATI